MTRKFNEIEFEKICNGMHEYFKIIETIDEDGDLHSRPVSLVVKDMRNDKYYSCTYQKSLSNLPNEYCNTSLKEIDFFDKKLDYVMDSEYFRYLMKKRNIDSEKLASKLGVSRTQINYKILKGSFNLKDIHLILKRFNMKFEDVFRIEKEE
jgi:hypothetical protein